MKCNSYFEFKQDLKYKSVYVLQKFSGEKIKGFPGIGKRGNYKGLPVVRFCKPSKQALQKLYSKALYVGSDYLTGLSCSPEQNPFHFSGDDKKIKLNDCMLVEISPDNTILKIWFVKRMANHSKAILEKWNNGDMLESVDSDLLPLIKKPPVACENN